MTTEPVPWVDGLTFAEALARTAERHPSNDAVVFPQLGASGLAPAHRLLQERLAAVHDDPAVCDALREVGATHLYQDTATAADGAKVDDRTAGMRDVDVSTGFTAVASAGSATVHRIEVCGR